MTAVERRKRDYRAEARAFLRCAIEHCERLVEEREREFLRGAWRERILDAGHGAEITLDRLRYVLEALDRGNLETALLVACDRLCDLTLLIDRTSEGFVSIDERKRGGSAKRRSTAQRLAAVEHRIAELKRRDARTYRSERACLMKIHTDACADPEALRRYFPGRAEPTSFESFGRWFHDARSRRKKKVVKRTR